jgi:deoxyribose-phosphate aldolase
MSGAAYTGDGGQRTGDVNTPLPASGQGSIDRAEVFSGIVASQFTRPAPGFAQARVRRSEKGVRPVTTPAPDRNVVRLQHAQREPQDGALQRNPGTALDLSWVAAVRVNRSAVERRAATLPARRSVKKDWQAAWLLRAISCMDLTTLSGDDTPGTVRRLCAKARRPLREDLLAALGMADSGLTVAAVCVYHAYVETAVAALQGSGIPVAAVSTGFPAGLSPFPQRLAEIGASVEAGAAEIDIVVTRAHVLNGEWQALYDEVRAFREACGEAHLKTIIATGELGTLRNVGRASLVCMMAGADFIKTSTGKESVNATLPFGLVMTRAIRDYQEQTGHIVGFKPAGGIRAAKEALSWLALMKEELGDRWLRPDLFRFGASSLLGDIERQLEHHLTGRYSAAHRHPSH